MSTTYQVNGYRVHAAAAQRAWFDYCEATGYFDAAECRATWHAAQRGDFEAIERLAEAGVEIETREEW
jgi:hypothetical protein